jgi:imidazolonepropionase-like amidohydrolase
MKKLFFIFTSLLFLHPLKAQIKYSTEAKRFIDYDTISLAFIHALLIDGTGNAAKENQTIIVRNGKIAWIGDDKKATIPKEAQVIDLAGKTLMPGLVMLHEHMYIRVPGADYFFVKQMPISFPRLYLACGATTIKTAASHEPYFDLAIKREIDSGKFAGPTMFLTAPYIEGAIGPVVQMHGIATEKAAIQDVNYWGDQGFYSFKAYQNISNKVLKAAIDAAHKRGQKISGHLCSVTYREAADLGIDHLEHGFITCNDFVKTKKENECPTGMERANSIAALDLTSDSVTALIQLLVRKKIGITSTLAVYEGIMSTQPAPRPEHLEILSSEHRENYLKNYNQIIANSSSGAIAFNKSFRIAARMEKLFSDAGGLLTVGTDPTGNGGIIAGYSNWRAIELLVEAAGFTPLEALKIATLNGAIDLGIDKITGTITVGKEADLIVMDGDPSKNISDIRKVVWVFKDGVGFNSKKMFESVKGKVGYY